MKTTLFRTICAAVLALAMLSPAAPLMAQQPKLPPSGCPLAPQAPVMASPPVTAAPAQSAAVPAPAAAAQPAPVAAQPAAVPAGPRCRSATARGQQCQGAEIDGRGAARIVAVVDVHVGRHHRQGGHDRPCLRLGGDLDRLHRENDRAVGGAGQTAPGAAKSRRCAFAGGSAIRAGQQGQRAVGVAGCRHERGAVVGGHFQRRRHQGTRGVELWRNRARRRPPDPDRDGAAWPPSAPHRRSSACSAPSGAS